MEGDLILISLMLTSWWVSVFFLCGLDKLRGRRSTSLTSEWRRHSSSLAKLKWWQHLIRVPLYCLFIPALVFFCLLIAPPAYAFNLITGSKFGTKPAWPK